MYTIQEILVIKKMSGKGFSCANKEAETSLTILFILKVDNCCFCVKCYLCSEKTNPLSKLLRIWDFLICIFKTTTARFYSGYNIRSCWCLLSCILFYLNQGSNNSFAKEAGMKAHCYHQLVIWVQLWEDISKSVKLYLASRIVIKV